MKIAWLVWSYEDGINPMIFFDEPDSYHFKIIQIVYTEVIQ